MKYKGQHAQENGDDAGVFQYGDKGFKAFLPCKKHQTVRPQKDIKVDDENGG